MLSPTTPRQWLARFLIGLGLLLAAGSGMLTRAFGIRDPIGVLSFLAGLYGFHLALGSVGPLIRVLNFQSLTRRPWDKASQTTFARASLPRRIYYLLMAVAQADGPTTAAEREVVREFVLGRLAEPVDPGEVRLWEAQPLTIDDRVGLAARIAPSLTDPELDTLFCWCALVAFADGKFLPDEHQALQEVARGLGIPAGRARMLFHLARAQFLQQRQRSAGGGGTRREAPRYDPPADARAQALAVLDLPAEATPDQIRRRHRELVRKFHPDAQPNLGPVALKEATERFTAIQRAYELLTASQ